MTVGKVFFGNISGTIFSEVAVYWKIVTNEIRQREDPKRAKNKSFSLHMRNIVLSFSELKYSPFRGTVCLYLSLWSKSMHCAILKSVLLHLTE